jgi:hypothetical protein
MARCLRPHWCLNLVCVQPENHPGRCLNGTITWPRHAPVEVTDEMREAVHREDALLYCTRHGHNYAHECAADRSELSRVSCTRCGRSWLVTTEPPHPVA